MRKYLASLSVITLAFCLTSCQKQAPPSPASATIDGTKYYAVVLSNGTLYFGHVEGLGSQFPVLTDVYYVQTTQNNDTKAVSSVRWD